MSMNREGQQAYEVDDNIEVLIHHDTGLVSIENHEYEMGVEMDFDEAVKMAEWILTMLGTKEERE